jgi:hypothetical protein
MKTAGRCTQRDRNPSFPEFPGAQFILAEPTRSQGLRVHERPGLLDRFCSQDGEAVSHQHTLLHEWAGGQKEDLQLQAGSCTGDALLRWVTSVRLAPRLYLVRQIAASLTWVLSRSAI